MAPNTSLSNEIAETHDQMLSELSLWENEINEETGELNMHSLAKKKNGLMIQQLSGLMVNR